MKRSLLVGLLVVAVATAVYIVFFRATDEAKIRRRLDQIALAVQVDAGEKSPMLRALRIQKEFAKGFTEDATASIEELDEGLEGRDELVKAAVQVGGAYTSASVTFDKINVRINGPAAEVKANATVTGARQGSNVRYESMRVKLDLKKIDGDWLVASAHVGPATAHDTPDP